MTVPTGPWVLLVDAPTDGVRMTDAVERARCMTRADRVVAVLPRSTQLREIQALARLVPANVLVQPTDRGTAAEVLLGMMRVVNAGAGHIVVVLSARRLSDQPAALEADVARAVERAEASEHGAQVLGAPSGDAWAVVARPDEIVRMYEHTLPAMLAIFLHELVKRRHWQPWQVARMYQLILTRDFGADVLARGVHEPAELAPVETR